MSPIPFTRCPLCPRHRQPVFSTGPIPCPILLLGEAPSYQEDRDGCPFVGPTGQELNYTYLRLAGLDRDQVHIANGRFCSEVDYENPAPEQTQSCAWMNLGPLIAAVQPSIIVPMGAVTCSLFPEVKDLNLQHGKPVMGKWGSARFVVWPSFHPSAGIHSGGFMIPLMKDFDELGKFLRQTRLI